MPTSALIPNISTTGPTQTNLAPPGQRIPPTQETRINIPNNEIPSTASRTSIGRFIRFQSIAGFFHHAEQIALRPVSGLLDGLPELHPILNLITCTSAKITELACLTILMDIATILIRLAGVTRPLAPSIINNLTELDTPLLIKMTTEITIGVLAAILVFLPHTAVHIIEKHKNRTHHQEPIVLPTGHNNTPITPT